MSHSLDQAIRNRSAVVGIIGLGYVGLPLMSAFVKAGFRTMGFDIDQKKVDMLKAGQSYIKHIDAQFIAGLIKEGKFEPTSDFSRLKEPDCLIIAVPTPLNDTRDPDLSYVEGSTQAIAKTLRPGQLVILESTTYPTTTRDVCQPILDATGMKLGSDFGLLVLRVAVGCIMFVHGAQKLLGWFDGPGIAGFMGWMASMHVPAPAAWQPFFTPSKWKWIRMPSGNASLG